MDEHRYGQHSLLEDGLALLVATLLLALGIIMVSSAGLITPGAAGIAFLLHYKTGYNFSICFFAINLPFYWLAWQRMGARFTCKTFLAVLLLSLWSAVLPAFVGFSHVSAPFAAIMGGILCGVGFLALFRHQGSLGGVSIAAAWLQATRGWRAGLVQMAVDIAIFGAALFMLDPGRVMWSALCAVILNLVVIFNHRPGRYVVGKL